MVTTEALEYTKKELALEINSFDKPTELSEVAAWSQLLLYLLYLRPGTYPSIPAMGVGIENYQYDFLDDAIEQLSTDIVNQQQTYLEDIPLSGIEISKYNNKGHMFMIIQFIFNIESGSTSSAVAIDAESRNYLDFEVSWTS